MKCETAALVHDSSLLLLHTQGMPGPVGERGAKGDPGLPVCSKTAFHYLSNG